MKSLWSEDEFGDLWLDNPHLSILTTNPKRRPSRVRRKTKMAKIKSRPRDAKGRFRKRAGGRRWTARVYASGRTRRVKVTRHPVLVNDPGRRKKRRSYAYAMNRRRRSPVRRRYRHNPRRFAGLFGKITITNVVSVGVGMVGTPLMSGFINRYLPATISANRYAGYAVKGASAWLLSFAAEKAVGKQAGRAVLIGGLAYLAVNVITDFFPTLIPSTSGAGRYLYD